MFAINANNMSLPDFLAERIPLGRAVAYYYRGTNTKHQFLNAT